MQGKKVLCGSALAAITVGLAACVGSLDGSGKPDVEVVGEHAAIVAMKRQWLQNYEGHCNVCFEAFELCQSAAESNEVLDACELAMNTCVRAGLVDQDAGTVDQGANEDADVDRDADVDEDSDVVDEDSSVDAEDADAGKRDAGRSNGFRRDAGANLDTDAGFADAVDASVVVADGDAGGVENANDSKAQLIVDIQACLADAGACLDGGEPAQCLGALRTCVKTTLQGTFQNICARQVGACRNERGPRPALESVEGICARDLDN